LGARYSVLGVVVSEIAANNGLGQESIKNFDNFQIGQSFAVLVMIATMATMLGLGISLIQRHIAWGQGRVASLSLPAGLRSTMAGLRLEQFKYLEAIVRHGSLRRAAKELGLAQPSLTQQIQRLEQEIDIQVFDRTVFGVQLTAAGESIMRHVRTLLAAEEAVRQEVAAYRGLHTGSIRLGAVNSASVAILPEVLSRFSRKYPGIEIHVTEAVSLSIERMVLAADIEVGIALIAEKVHPLPAGVVAEPLMRAPLVVCVSPTSRLAKRSDISLADLRQEPLILGSRGALTTEILTKAGLIEPGAKHFFDSNSPDTLKRMAAAGYGVIVLPMFSVEGNFYSLSPNVTVVPISDAIEVHVALLHRAQWWPSRAITSFLDALHEHLRATKARTTKDAPRKADSRGLSA
jgi:DNA-binding transcriptional LysR family regulator